MRKMMKPFRRLMRDQQGLSAIEYGVLASLIVLGALQALDGLGSETRETMDVTSDKVAQQAAAQAARGGGQNDQSNPDEPPAAGDAPIDSPADYPAPDEPPVAAAATIS